MVRKWDIFALAFVPSAIGAVVLDGSVHVWPSSPDFPKGDYVHLLDTIAENKVDGAVCVQPINLGFDHSYLCEALAKNGDKLKGVMLFDPREPVGREIDKFEDLKPKGFAGIRLNPALFNSSNGGSMGDHRGCGRLFQHCASESVAVSVLCIGGFSAVKEDLLSLRSGQPQARLLLDHYGLVGLGTKEQDDQYEDMLDFCRDAAVAVKASATFRNVQPEEGREKIRSNEEKAYERLYSERLKPLVDCLGGDRVMWGTDFPYVNNLGLSYAREREMFQDWLGRLGKEKGDKVKGQTLLSYYGQFKKLQKDGTST